MKSQRVGHGWATNTFLSLARKGLIFPLESPNNLRQIQPSKTESVNSRTEMTISRVCLIQWHVIDVFGGNNFFSMISVETEGCSQCQLIIDKVIYFLDVRSSKEFFFSHSLRIILHIANSIFLSEALSFLPDHWRRKHPSLPDESHSLLSKASSFSVSRIHWLRRLTSLTSFRRAHHPTWAWGLPTPSLILRAWL